MNNDTKFQQIWDFRRKEDEDDSSSDYSKSTSNGSESLGNKFKVVDALVSVPNCNEPDAKIVVSKPAKAPKRKAKNDVSKPAKAPKGKAKNDVSKLAKDPKRNAKKKSACPTEKPKKSLPVKENKRRKRGIGSKDPIMEDLKTFAGSVIHELTIAREEMSERMREVARTLVPVLESVKKKGGRAPKRKSQPQKGLHELNGKAQKRSRGQSKTNVRKRGKLQEQVKADEPMSLKSNVASNPGKSPQIEARSATPSSLVVPTPFSTFPTTMPSSINNNLVSDMETGRGMDAKTVHPGFNSDEQFGSFSNFFSGKTPGFCIQSYNAGVGMLLHRQHQGIEIAYETTFGVKSDDRAGKNGGCKMQQNGDRVM